MIKFYGVFGLCLCSFLAARAGAALPAEALRQAADAGLEQAITAGALEAATPLAEPVPQPAGFSGTADCYKAASPLTKFPPLLCAGAASAAPAVCFTAAKDLTDVKRASVFSWIEEKRVEGRLMSQMRGKYIVTHRN